MPGFISARKYTVKGKGIRPCPGVRVHVCVCVCKSETSDRSKGVFVSKPNQEQQSNQISVRANLLPGKKDKRA